MKFRIRKDVETREDALANSREYISFLRSQKIDEESDLMRFFLNDFFHDGIIQNIQFANGMNKIQFKVESPSIYHLQDQDENDFTLIDSEFIWTFFNVAHFEMKTPDKKDEILEDNEGFCFRRLQFIAAEINTLSEYIDKYSQLYENRFYSLLIKTCSDIGSVYIGIVFEDLSVVSKEPLAFQMIQNDPRFKIPGLYVSKENK